MVDRIKEYKVSFEMPTITIIAFEAAELITASGDYEGIDFNDLI